MAELPVSPYLEQEVLNASPAKLRWLLINKAVQLTRVAKQLMADNNPEATQWSLWLRDVLNELLAAVHGTDELAKRVTDLYIFMLKLLTEAERDRKPEQLGELQALLEIEAETWMLVQQKSLGTHKVL